MAKELKTTFRIASFGMVEGIGGFWIADQEAVQSGAQADGFFFKGKTTSPLFDAIRTPSVAYCIALRLQDGQRAYGDCMTVANLGLGGRPDPALAYLAGLVERGWGAAGAAVLVLAGLYFLAGR